MVIHLLEQSPSHAVRVTAPFTQGGLWCGATGETILDKSHTSPVDCCLLPVSTAATHLFSFPRKENANRVLLPAPDSIWRQCVTNSVAYRAFPLGNDGSDLNYLTVPMKISLRFRRRDIFTGCRGLYERSTAKTRKNDKILPSVEGILPPGGSGSRQERGSQRR